MDKQNEIISNNLKRLIAKSGLQQNQIAEAIGISPQSFNQYVKGIACPRMNRTQAIADYFGVTVSEIVDEAFVPTDEEQRLLILFEHLNNEGKKRLLEQADFLIERYRK